MTMNGKSRHTWPLIMMLVLPVATAALAQDPSKAPKGKQDQGAAQPQKGEQGVTPDAARMLRQMTDYLGGLQRFSLESASVDEVVTKEGQKIQVISDSQVSVARPSHLKSERAGRNPATFTYDGKSMSVVCPDNNTYGTVAAPGTVDETIDKMRKDYKVDAPGADLLYSHPYDILMEQVKQGQVIGHETLLGVETNHLAFQGDEVDWQIWIKDGAEPLPVRYVITSKTVKSQPQFTVQMTKWDPHAKVEDAAFEFKPPPGAKKVNGLPTDCAKNK
jgi:hypothetical protein